MPYRPLARFPKRERGARPALDTRVASHRLHKIPGRHARGQPPERCRRRRDSGTMGSLLLWAALNATTPHRRLTNRPTRTAPLGPAPKAIVLFTHLRRCGGSFVEEALLKPHAKRLGSKPLLCKEGALARLQRLAHPLRRQFKRQLAEAPLVWRHCPFGAHELLGDERPYVYITMLRKPFSRMASWFAYCDKYSRDKCHTAPYQVHGGSKILNFYQARKRKYDSIEPSKLDTARNAPVINAQTFHPNWLESVRKSTSHFPAMTRPSWLGRAARNRHRHAIEQTSRRWRGGRRGDSGRTRRKILISTQVGVCFR